MKKIIKITIVCIIVVFLVYLVKRTDALDLCVLSSHMPKEDATSYEQNKTLYYYAKLTEQQKKIYYQIDKNVREFETELSLGISNDKDNMAKQVDLAVEAYLNDHPDYIQLSNSYVYKESNFLLFNVSSIELKYEISDKAQMEIKQKELSSSVDSLINETITKDMTQYEKELAVHDKLVSMVKYYQYEDITKIPEVKHSAYGALVQKEAVCDGIAKAFQLVMNKLDIPTIVVSGKVQNISHAWNIIKLDDEYYHVDVTIDSITRENKKHVIHAYFNIDDTTSKKSHLISESFEVPSCLGKKYNYYKYSGRYLDKNTNITAKIAKIISETDGMLELATDSITPQEIVTALYKLNYNDYRSKGNTSINYNNIDNVYFFI